MAESGIGADGSTDRRIADVVEATGVSKELVHHYLRQEVLPQSHSRGWYSERQVRLLRLVRTLREDHGLALDLIRRVFEYFGHDPDRIEPLVMSESVARRAVRLAVDGRLMPAKVVSAAELCEAAGLTPGRLEEYVRARLVSAPAGAGAYSECDVNVVALCERGRAHGIPFESFRSIAAYVRLAYELQNAVFFDLAVGPDGETARAAEGVLADLFLRRELATAFVQNVLHGLMQAQLRVEVAPARKAVSLDDVIYRPSAAFVRRHGLDRAIDDARDQVARDGATPSLWRRAADLMLHAGRYDEAALFLEQAQKRWPEDAALRAAGGRALLLSGACEGGCARLEELCAGDSPSPHAPLLLALWLFRQASSEAEPEALVRHAARIAALVDHAVRAVGDLPTAESLSVRTFGGWLLSALPPVFRDERRAARLLVGAWRALAEGAPSGPLLPGERARLRINNAYLLLDALRRGVGAADPPTKTDAPRAETLRALLFELDPASALAEAAYLAAPPVDAGAEPGPPGVERQGERP